MEKKLTLLEVEKPKISKVIICIAFDQVLFLDRKTHKEILKKS